MEDFESAVSFFTDAIADIMSDTSLIKFDEYVSELVSTRQACDTLKSRCESNQYLHEYMSPLVGRLETCHESFVSTEQNDTVPIFESLREDLSSLGDVPSLTQMTDLRSLLDSKLGKLRHIISKHNDTLTELKTLENSAQRAQSALQSRAASLKEEGKDRKKAAAAVAVVGGLLAPFTFGGSLVLGAVGASGLYDSGEELLVEYRTLRSESAKTFESFSSTLNTSIRFIQTVAGAIKELSTEIQSISATKTVGRLTVAKAKADELSNTLKKYIMLFELIYPLCVLGLNVLNME